MDTPNLTPTPAPDHVDDTGAPDHVEDAPRDTKGMFKQGGPRPGAGRKAGSKNVKTLEKQAELANSIGDFKGTTREFLEKVRDAGNVSLSYRLDAAKALFAREEATLQSVTVSEKQASVKATAKEVVGNLSEEKLIALVAKRTLNSKKGASSDGNAPR